MRSKLRHELQLECFLIPLILHVYSESSLGRPHFVQILVATIYIQFRTYSVPWMKNGVILKSKPPSFFKGGLIVENPLFLGEGDGERSRNLMLHRHALCQLSYALHEKIT